MTGKTLLATLDELLALECEREWVERKEAKTSFDSNDLGKYFSALSNEANLNGEEFGWLIFGVADNGEIVGTTYRSGNPAFLESVKHEVARHTSNSLTFINIYEINHPSGKRVLLFQIPAAPQGMPTNWKGHYYGRDGESLVALNIEEIERIRKQAVVKDWTAEVCAEATFNDLTPEAVQKAREEFMKKNPRIAADVPNWDDITFLNKAMLLKKGRITRAAIILLGRRETEPLISPSVATITWILKDNSGCEKDFEHFGPPWLLNIDAVYGKIRNLRYRHMPDGTLFPIEVDQYDKWVFREALNNCIAHQDYTQRSKITVVEYPDCVLFRNAGSFIPQSIEEVIESNAPTAQYRNPFLARAMVNLNMIDTIGSGIRRMFLKQRERLFPLPEFELKKDSVSVTVMGKIIDHNYVQHLFKNLNLNLHEVILLDRIQKGIKISQDEAKVLRKKNLIEGKYPRLYIGSHIAAISKQKANYLHSRGLDEQHYAELIVEHIRKFNCITRKEADELLFEKLSKILNDKQKKNKVHRILSVVLKRRIKNIGSRTSPNYVLNEDKNRS